EKYYDGDLLEAVRRAKKDLKGSYAWGVIAQSEPDRLICLRCESPLILGLSDKGCFVASDIPSILKYTIKLIYLENGDLIDNNDGYKIYDAKNNLASRDIKEITWSLEDANKDGYEHFMLKEIYEQPRAIEDCLRNKVIDGKIDLGEASFT